MLTLRCRHADVVSHNAFATAHEAAVFLLFTFFFLCVADAHAAVPRTPRRAANQAVASVTLPGNLGSAAAMRSTIVQRMRGAERLVPADDPRRVVHAVYLPLKPRRGRAAASSGVRGLTRRESEVADLLHDRFSAGEIAERLRISRRTVEKHIEHVYLKLGIHSRRGIRAEAGPDPESGGTFGNTRISS